ncbi:hypothetical protein [Streptomyces sp. Rer75]|uniref:hypothetical protein n=1 Tax=unclassified Streptomyces TaxID=2593676 RepID=UPI0015CFA737|nr:hypothetical protein [Streptomyces sp. Rer75]QLH19611.1 hypothetical protein HYQ63_02260 [Streptomyces sp. Rer75]
MTSSPDEDDWPEAAPARRPSQVTAAASLLIVSAFLGTTIAVNDPAMTQFVYLLLFVTIGAAVRILGGGRKARVTGTVTAVLLLLYLGPHAIWGLAAPGGVFQPDYAVRAILAIGASGTGVSLLYAPRSRAYFRVRPRQTVR